MIAAPLPSELLQRRYPPALLPPTSPSGAAAGGVGRRSALRISRLSGEEVNEASAAMKVRHQLAAREQEVVKRFLGNIIMDRAFLNHLLPAPNARQRRGKAQLEQSLVSAPAPVSLL